MGKGGGKGGGKVDGGGKGKKGGGGHFGKGGGKGKGKKGASKHRRADDALEEDEHLEVGEVSEALDGDMGNAGNGSSEAKGKGRGKSKKSEDLNLPRTVDPSKARELLVSWLVRKYNMPRTVAESQEAISESMTQQRSRGAQGPMYTCILNFPILGIGPVGGMEPHPKRKAAIAAAYVAAIAEFGVPVPAKSAMSQKALLKQEQQRLAQEQRAEQQRNKQRELQERRAAQKAAAKLEQQQRMHARCIQVFQEKLCPQVQASFPGGEICLPAPIQACLCVTKGGDRAEQRATSDLSNLCSKESSLFDGNPLYFEKSETMPGSGSLHFTVAMVKVRGADGANLWPVIGCAFGSKRGTAKSAAARQCLKRIIAKASLPVAAEMAEEQERCKQEGILPNAEAWASMCNAVSELRKLEAKGGAGLRLAVVETASGTDASEPTSGLLRCVLTGRVPQEHGLRDFRGVSKAGRCSVRLAIASACQDAIARLSVVFGGGDVTSWLRRMIVTPMELEDLPWDISRGLWEAKEGSEERELELTERLEAWSQQRAARCVHVAIAPDLSAGAAAVVQDVYTPPKGNGQQDPLEKSKRERGVPLLPVRSLRNPLAKILSNDSVLVVSGGTGSGKSTQLPQYIVDDWVGVEGARKRRPRVVVTQPRRIAAISVAERVAWERGESIGNTVGYTVRNDAKPPRSRDGSIEFCTVGILLRRLMDPRDPNLGRYTHVLVDEVHERDLMTDFLLILLKELLARRGDIRVILMSATLDVSTFCTYFWDCSCLEVPSGPRYPVEECYLEDLVHDAEMEALQAMQHQQRLQMSMESESAQLYYSADGSNGGWLQGNLNPEAAEFVPGGGAWAADQAQETGEEKDEVNAGDEGGDDEEGADDEAAEDAGDADDDDDDEDDEEDDEAGAGKDDDGLEEQHLQAEAPRFKEYISWNMQELAQNLLKKEENSRRAFEAEQAEIRAEKAETGGSLADAEVEAGGPDAGDDGDPDAEAQASTGLWWGSFEDGEALFELCARLLVHLVFKAETQQGGIFDDKGKPGSILVFLPGWAEIKSVMEKLQQMPQAENLWVLPLHSTLAKEDQQKIFQHPPPGKTKIILSTNIAESSVTIDDVLIVVDAGLMRELSYDPVRRLSTLETVWVSQSSSIQRKGRAGRVRNGKCYRLFSRTQFESTPWRTAPEMQRCELSATCLQALAMQREVRDFLARAPDPPALSAVESALRELVQLGAIAPPPGGSQEPPPESGTIQLQERMLPLGETLSRMPLSPCLGRMLILGVLFQCVDTACLLAAVISAARRPFVCPPGKRKESLAFQRGFDPSSDLLTCFAAAEVFEQKLAAPSGYRTGEDADRFAIDRFLMPQRLRQLLRARDSLREELVRAKLVDRHAAHQKYTKKEDEEEEEEDADVGGWGAWEDDAGQEGHHYYSKKWQDPAFAALHAHEGEVELQKALLVAAYPTNLAMRRRPFLAKHRTPTGLEAIVAPQSLNAQPRGGKGGGKETERRGGPSWWAYGSMQISNKQGFLRTTTLVDPYHIVLFGGLSVEYRPERGAKRSAEQSKVGLEGLAGGGTVSMIDEWMELQGSNDTLGQLSYLRDEIRRCIHLKVLDPSEPLPTASQWLLDAVATGVLRTASRRQNRILGLLPQQLVMPPGGSMKHAEPRAPALPDYSIHSDGWDSYGGGYDYDYWGGDWGWNAGSWGYDSRGKGGKGKNERGGKTSWGHSERSERWRGEKGGERGKPAKKDGKGSANGKGKSSQRENAPERDAPGAEGSGVVWQ